MAEPTKKSKTVDGFIDLIMGGQPGDNLRAKTVRSGLCVASPIGCGGKIGVFRDAVSKREHAITGFCQNCQDNMFGV